MKKGKIILYPPLVSPEFRNGLIWAAVGFAIGSFWATVVCWIFL